MKITSIKQQVRRPDRYSIFVDGNFGFSLSESGLLENKLINGQELSREDLRQYKTKAEADRLHAQVLHFTALRVRSEWEIQEYLKRKHTSPPLAQIILNKLSKDGIINDETFATAWIENRRLLKPTSRRRLAQELHAKRVSRDIIEEVLDKDEADDHQILRELVMKKRKQVKYHSDQLKLMQYLARQGFNYDDIKSVLREED